MDPRPGAAHPDVRRHNLSTVLRALLDEGPRSRAALAQSTGLTKATVGKLVSDLEARGLVRETEIVHGRSGRPAMLVAASPERAVALALLVEVDALAVAAIDLTGHAHRVEQVPSDNRQITAAQALRRLGTLGAKLLTRLEGDGRIVTGTTLAVPGLVSHGRVLVAPNLGWHDVDAGALLAARLGPNAGAVLVDNEANLAALAEARLRRVEASVGAADDGGRGRDPSHRRDDGPRPGTEQTFIHVSAGVGVGAGVVIDGGLFRGAHGFGGEFGHLVIDPAGARCRCGNRGCLETIVGRDQVVARTGIDGPGTTWIDQISDAAAAGDERALSALRTIGTALASGLATAVSLFDPEAIVLGGFLTDLTPWLAPAIETELEARVLGARFVPYPVQPSQLGALGPLVGAGLSSLQAVVDDPTAFPDAP